MCEPEKDVSYKRKNSNSLIKSKKHEYYGWASNNTAVLCSRMEMKNFKIGGKPKFIFGVCCQIPVEFLLLTIPHTNTKDTYILINKKEKLSNFIERLEVKVEKIYFPKFFK